LKHAIDRMDFFLAGLVRTVDHVQDQVGFTGLNEGGAKCRDQVVRQMPNKSHGIRKNYGLLFG